jgi:hypothetical protein
MTFGLGKTIDDIIKEIEALEFLVVDRQDNGEDTVIEMVKHYEATWDPNRVETQRFDLALMKSQNQIILTPVMARSSDRFRALKHFGKYDLNAFSRWIKVAVLEVKLGRN